ncbi:hypothetical protein PG993_009826 [Apiospora rasikravindrae]|uniref:RBR-type E3 ubiquitin transferase n=1 Tax=Apiospora rasikravindrae TaxID=990691 RepID=A0ABR1SKH4_9PEZI
MFSSFPCRQSLQIAVTQPGVDKDLPPRYIASHTRGIEHPLCQQPPSTVIAPYVSRPSRSRNFPDVAPQAHVTIPPTACRDCVQSSLLAQFEEKAMEHITCLECPEMLGPGDVQAFVPRAKYQRYAEHGMNKTLSSLGQFVWCPLNGCESGQIHSPGTQQPVVLCQSCNRLFCFTHHAEWHREYTCEEWDQHLADGSFRSQAQQEQDQADAYDADMATLDRRINEAEHMLRQSIMSAEEAAKERFEFAEARRREEERAAAERARIEEQRRLVREEEERKRARRQEMEEGERTVEQKANRCPRCQRPTEKNGGWILGSRHMRCPYCGCDWDYYEGYEYPKGTF